MSNLQNFQSAIAVVRANILDGKYSVEKTKFCVWVHLNPNCVCEESSVYANTDESAIKLMAISLAQAVGYEWASSAVGLHNS